VGFSGYGTEHAGKSKCRHIKFRHRVGITQKKDTSFRTQQKFEIKKSKQAVVTSSAHAAQALAL
jgi:hypothetical protein